MKEIAGQIDELKLVLGADGLGLGLAVKDAAKA